MPHTKIHLAGKSPESAAFLNQLGSCSTDLCTEEMLFGLGGGLGLTYFIFDLHGYHPIVVGTRYHASEAETPVFVMQMGSDRRQDIYQEMKDMKTDHIVSTWFTPGDGELQARVKLFKNSTNPEHWVIVGKLRLDKLK